MPTKFHLPRHSPPNNLSNATNAHPHPYVQAVAECGPKWGTGNCRKTKSMCLPWNAQHPRKKDVWVGMRQGNTPRVVWGTCKERICAMPAQNIIFKPFLTDGVNLVLLCTVDTMDTMDATPVVRGETVVEQARKRLGGRCWPLRWSCCV